MSKKSLPRGWIKERLTEVAELNPHARLDPRGRGNILEHLLLQVCGLNLGLRMRHILGVGTPRGLWGGAGIHAGTLLRALRCSSSRLSRAAALVATYRTVPSWSCSMLQPSHAHLLARLRDGPSTTACEKAGGVPRGIGVCMPAARLVIPKDDCYSPAFSVNPLTAASDKPCD